MRTFLEVGQVDFSSCLILKGNSRLVTLLFCRVLNSPCSKNVHDSSNVTYKHLNENKKKLLECASQDVQNFMGCL